MDQLRRNESTAIKVSHNIWSWKSRILNEPCDFTSLSASESLATKLSGKTPCLPPISPLHQPCSPVSWRQNAKHFYHHNYQFVMAAKRIKEFGRTSQQPPLDGGNNWAGFVIKKLFYTLSTRNEQGRIRIISTKQIYCMAQSQIPEIFVCALLSGVCELFLFFAKTLNRCALDHCQGFASWSEM